MRLTIADARTLATGMLPLSVLRALKREARDYVRKLELPISKGGYKLG